MALTDFPDFVRNNPEIEIPLPEVRGWTITGERQQTVFVEFAARTEVPSHAHADQWELVIAGRVELHREGGTENYATGDSFFIPAGQSHGATVHAGYKALIVFAEPDRYRPRT